MIGVGSGAGMAGGRFSRLRARSRPRSRNATRTITIAAAITMARDEGAGGGGGVDCAVTLNVRSAEPRNPEGSTTSRWNTAWATARSGAVHVTDVTPVVPATSGVVTLSIVTLAQTGNRAAGSKSSDIVHANVIV